MGEFKSDIALIEKYFGKEFAKDHVAYVSRHNVRLGPDYANMRNVELEFHQNGNIVEASAEGIKFMEIDTYNRTITMYAQNINRNSNWYLERALSLALEGEMGWGWMETHTYGKRRVFLFPKGTHQWEATRHFTKKSPHELKHMVMLDYSPESYSFTYEGIPVSSNLVRYNVKGKVVTKW